MTLSIAQHVGVFLVLLVVLSLVAAVVMTKIEHDGKGEGIRIMLIALSLGISLLIP